MWVSRFVSDSGETGAQLGELWPRGGVLILVVVVCALCVRVSV